MDATHQILESLIHYWNEFLAQVPAILAAILVIAVGILFANYLASLTRRTLSPRMNDPLMTNFLSKSIKTVLVLLVIILAMKIAGLDGIVTGLITAAGASAIIVGFAFRDIGENFIAGLILSFNRPFDMNDTVLIGDLFGRIKTMEFRYTKMKTFDGRDVYIPNADVIKKPVINYTEDGFFRLDFVVGIAYEDNYDEAETLVLEVVRQCEGVIDEPGHECYIALDELAASTVNLRIFFWVSTLDYRKEAIKIKSSVMAQVKTAIEDAGYNMPADIKEIKLYGSQQSIPVQVIGAQV